MTRKASPGDFPGGPWLRWRLRTPFARDPGFDPWLGIELLHATTEMSHAVSINKSPHDTMKIKDPGNHTLRPSAVK